MTFQVTGDSKEAVAFGLMRTVLFAEGRANEAHPFPAGSSLLRGRNPCSESEILSLYARCLKVVQGAEPQAAAHAQAAVSSGTPLHS